MNTRALNTSLPTWKSPGSIPDEILLRIFTCLLDDEESLPELDAGQMDSEFPKKT